MKNRFKGLMIASVSLLFATGADAQMLRLHVADAHTRENMSVTWSPDYDKMDDEMCEMEDDGNGNYTFNPDMTEQFNWVYLEIFGSNRPLVIEKGKTMDVTVTGRSAPSYSVNGANAAASSFLKRLDLAISNEHITGYGTDGNNASQNERLRVLENTLAPLKAQAAKITPEETGKFVSRITEMYECYFRLGIIGGDKGKNALYNIGSADYDKAIAMVKVNDPVYLRYRLNERFIINQMSKDDYGDGSDLTNYGLKFIEKMKAAGVTNGMVKHSMLDHLASRVLYQSHPKDASIFWKALSEYAEGDQALLKKYSGQQDKLQMYSDDGDF